MGLAHPGGPQENERANGLVGILQTRPVALDGLDHLLDCVVLANHLAFELSVHARELAAFFFCDALHGNASHHRDHISDVGLGYGHPLVLGLLLPCTLGLFKLIVEHALLVAQPRGLFVTLGADNLALVIFDFLNLSFNLDDFFWHVNVGQVHAAPHFIQSIDRLVGQMSIRDVPARKRHTRIDGLFGVLDAVVLLVLVLDVVKNLLGFLNCRGLHHDLLEATFQSAILLNVLAVFVEGGGANALNLPSRQGGLEHVGRVQRSAGAPGTHNGVDFVDE